MGNVLMGDLDGKTERIAFYTHEIEQIITKYKASIVSGNDEQDYMEYQRKIFSVQGMQDKEYVKPLLTL